MPLLRMGTQLWHHVHSPKVGRHPPLPPAAMAPSTPKLVVFLPPNHSTQQSPSNGTTSTPPKLVATLPPNHSTLQWHLTVARNGTTSTPPKLVVTLPSPHHSTLQWHLTVARNGTTSTPPKLVVTLPRTTMAPCNGSTTTPPKLVVTLRPPTIAHYNGTLQWHHDHSTKIGRHPPPPNHSTLQWHPAMAPRPLHQNWSSPSAPQP